MTDAPVTVADYPFSTTQMKPGMLDHRDVQIQLIDTPPVTDDYMPVHLFGLIRSADAVLITVDLANDDLIENHRAVLRAFSTRNVRFIDEQTDDHDEVLHRLIGTKADDRDADARLDLFREAEGENLDFFLFSAQRREDAKRFSEMLFDWLGIIRVYSKSPQEKKPHGRPFALFKGQTVEDLCRLIHRDLADQFEHARMWRNSDTPVTVSITEELEEGDIVEIHSHG